MEFVISLATVGRGLNPQDFEHRKPFSDKAAAESDKSAFYDLVGVGQCDRRVALGAKRYDMAMTQNNLGAALQMLGERESGTARFEEAVDAYARWWIE